MTRLQHIILLMVILASFVYIIVIQQFLALKNSSAEPVESEFRKVCAASFIRTSNYGIHDNEEDTSLSRIYVVTPTYLRPEMLAEMTRLAQTLLLVPQIQWVVAEDSFQCSDAITELLHKIGLPFVHIVSPMPVSYRKLRYVPRGVSNRRAALEWVKSHASDNGVVYFLDDDNAVDIKLFDEMRDTEKVSMWPVGLIGAYAVSSPILNGEGKVTGFYDGWPAGRKFQVDMAGFAINVGFLKKTNASMPYLAGHEEDGFLKSLHIQIEDLEPKANGCTEILVWHTRSVKNPQRHLKTHSDTNVKKLQDFMKYWSMIK